ncbi:MAG: nucleoside triphosphate pyrophosphohydrolase family protein [Candidatus Saccharimonadales bacterium]
MTIHEYSKQAISTLLDGHDIQNLSPVLIAQVFGILGESGEMAEKFKKLIRNKAGKLSEEDTQEILKELGDILWYINSVATLLGSDLEAVAQQNLDKVLSRKSRGLSRGSGDNR